MRTLGQSCPVLSDIRLTIGDVQVDNQMFTRGSFDFPVILKSHQGEGMARTFLAQNTTISNYVIGQLKETSLFCCSAVLEQDTNEAYFFKSIAFTIKPFDVFIEDVFIYKMLQVLKSFTLIDVATVTEPLSACAEATIAAHGLHGR